MVHVSQKPLPHRFLGLLGQAAHGVDQSQCKKRRHVDERLWVCCLELYARACLQMRVPAHSLKNHDGRPKATIESAHRASTHVLGRHESATVDNSSMPHVKLRGDMVFRPAANASKE